MCRRADDACAGSVRRAQGHTEAGKVMGRRTSRTTRKCAKSSDFSRTVNSPIAGQDGHYAAQEYAQTGAVLDPAPCRLDQRRISRPLAAAAPSHPTSLCKVAFMPLFRYRGRQALRQPRCAAVRHPRHRRRTRRVRSSGCQRPDWSKNPPPHPETRLDRRYAGASCPREDALTGIERSRRDEL